MTTQDEPSTSAQPRTAASLFLNIYDSLDALRHFIDGVWMAAGDVSGQAEILALRALLDVAGEKIDAMKGAMQEARDLLAARRDDANARAETEADAALVKLRRARQDCKLEGNSRGR